MAACSADAPRNSKPGAPVSINLQPVGPRTGEVLELEADARFLAPGRARLHITLPDELLLWSGDQQWEASLEVPTQHLLRFSVRVPEQGRHVITATASLQSGQGARYAVEARYVVGHDTTGKSSAPAPTPGIRNGERIEEHRL